MDNVYDDTELNKEYKKLCSIIHSSEEYTPLHIVKNMFDRIEKSYPTIWNNKHTVIIDPCCKTGIFLKYAYFKLFHGLRDIIVNDVDRNNYIINNMLFGFSRNEMQLYISRSLLYNNKFNSCCQSGQHNITLYNNHSLTKLINKSTRNNNLRNINVVIGNPPYQEMIKAKTDTAKSSAKLIYQLILLEIMNMKADIDYMSFIIPARWMTGNATGKNMKEFKQRMFNENHIKTIIDVHNASECFPKQGGNIDGGVCIFLYDKHYNGLCEYKIQKDNIITDVLMRDLKEDSKIAFVRDIKTYNIISHILKKLDNKYQFFFTDKNNSIVAAKTPYGLTNRCALGAKNQSNCNYLSHTFTRDEKYNIKVYGYDYRLNDNKCNDIIFIENNEELKLKPIINKYKIFIPAAYGNNNIADGKVVYPVPIIAEPMSVATEKYISIGCCDTEYQARSLQSYLMTKTIMFLIAAIKNTKNITRNTFSYVPIMDLNIIYTDDYLYKFFDLSPEQIDYIDKTIKLI
jgi:site-specific DNA-methyltransferase (adenine-specific)